MCGIAGFVDFTKSSLDFDYLKAITDALAKRGPDGAGYQIIDNEYAQIGFGHRRLSIIDLSEKSNQPMFSENHGSWLTFNGEIYNYERLKSEYLAGEELCTRGDTEVLQRLLDLKGTGSLQHLSGMFAFAYYKPNCKKVLIARDALGVKPLYYSFENDVFQFGSELKSFHLGEYLKLKIDQDAVAQYLKLGYINAPRSIYSNVKKLSPGTFIELDLSTKKITEVSHWNVNDIYQNEFTEEDDEIYKKFKCVANEAFNKRLVADVEVSSFLSGGIDSSLVTAVTSRYMANIQTYTIGFQQEKYDESIYAKEVAKALNIRNKTKIVEEKDFLNYVKYLPEVYDEPLADNSCIPTMILCQFAAQDVKVALSSDGGDEAYFGYRKFAFIKNLREKFSRKWLRKLVVITLSMLLPIAKLLDGFYYNFYSRVVKLRDIFNADNAVDALKAYETIYTPLEISKLIKRKFKKEESQISRNNSDHDIAAMLPYTYQYYLPSILAKVDRASMYFSLEVRDPMLDKDFVEFSARIPFHLKYHEKESKVLLKRYLSEFISRTIFERPKKGFNIPVYEWMKGQLNAEWKELLRNARWDELGIKAPQEIFNLDKKLSQGKAINADKLWNIYVLLKWHKHWHHEG